MTSAPNQKRLTDVLHREPVALLGERVLHRSIGSMKGSLLNLKDWWWTGTISRGACGIGHRDRLLWCAVTGDPRVVGANRHDRRVERAKASMIAKRERGCRVSSNQEATAFTLDDPSCVATPRVSTQARAPVLHFNRAHGHIAP